MRTSFHHQPEAQHPKSSAIHKLPADYPICWVISGQTVPQPKPSNVRYCPRADKRGSSSNVRFVPLATKRTATRSTQKERPPVRRSLQNPIRSFDQAAASEVAAAFLFLRQ